jgi:hypothetical protein
MLDQLSGRRWDAGALEVGRSAEDRARACGDFANGQRRVRKRPEAQADVDLEPFSGSACAPLGESASQGLALIIHSCWLEEQSPNFGDKRGSGKAPCRRLAAVPAFEPLPHGMAFAAGFLPSSMAPKLPLAPRGFETTPYCTVQSGTVGPACCGSGGLGMKAVEQV